MDARRGPSWRRAEPFASASGLARCGR